MAKTIRGAATINAVMRGGYISRALRREGRAAVVRKPIVKADALEDVCEAAARYANAQRVDKGIA